MESVEVVTVVYHLRLKLFFGQIQFGANNVCAVAQTFEPLLRIPIEESGAAVDQIFKSADHLVATDVFDLGLNGLRVGVRGGRLGNSQRLGADLVRIKTVALVEDPEI